MCVPLHQKVTKILCKCGSLSSKGFVYQLRILCQVMQFAEKDEVIVTSIVFCFFFVKAF